MNSPEQPVLFDTLATDKGFLIGRATLNRPKALNALNLQMCEMLLRQLRSWASDTSIVAVLLEGAGEKGFCAGGDVAEVARQVRAGGPQRYVFGDQFFEVEYQLDLLIHEYPKPIVAWSHGVCMGGGVGLTVGCSHRVVADQSRIAMPEIHIGLFPDVGGGYFLNRVPGGAGRVLALTGMIINEADALFAGLADFFVPMEAKESLLKSLQSLDWLAPDAPVQTDRNHDRVTRALLSMHRRYKAGLPTAHLQQYYDAIRFIAAQPGVTALRDALLVAAQEDPFFKAAAASLAAGSPTAAHVSDEYLRRCKRLSLREVLALDLVLAKAYQRHHDFPEGVRALLIDKDRKPQWSPALFEQVTPALVEAHFR